MTREFKTWAEMEKFVYAYNEENGNRYNDVKKPLSIACVFSNESPWDRHDYTEEERTYYFGNGDKHWYGECGGNSIFAHCPAERGLIRLDYYYRNWVIESITVTDKEG